MFRPDSTPYLKAKPGTRQSQDPEHYDRALLCASCKTVITWEKESIRIQDSHKHVFVNPSGLVFEVRCFAVAINTFGLGPLTKEFTWFPGYSWQTCMCTGCESQLGWQYQSDSGQTFFGLILDRLIRE